MLGLEHSINFADNCTAGINEKQDSFLVSF